MRRMLRECNANKHLPRLCGAGKRFHSATSAVAEEASLSLQGKVAVITGASSGIGRATAKLFNQQHASVIGIDVNLEGLRSLESECQHQANMESIQADVSNADQVNTYMTNIYEKYNQIDILCNFAGGVFNPFQLALHELEVETIQQTLSVNALGHVYNCKYAIKYMLQAIENGRMKGASIINTASVVTSAALAGYSDYIVSKHAVLGLTQAIVAEYAASGIRCNAIKPGMVNTAMMQRALQVAQKKGELFDLRIPMGRVAEPHEIARLCLFLASDLSAYMTGSAVDIDGGSSAVFDFAKNRFSEGT